MKADTENMRQNPDLATTAVIVIAAGNLEVGGRSAASAKSGV
jgi:hypothetical protein